jgi:hypothetical protein
MPAVFNVIGGMLYVRPKNSSDIIKVQFNFWREKRNEEDFVVKLVGALLVAAGAFFTPSNLNAKAGSLACRPDGVIGL